MATIIGKCIQKIASCLNQRNFGCVAFELIELCYSMREIELYIQMINENFGSNYQAGVNAIVRRKFNKYASLCNRDDLEVLADILSNNKLNGFQDLQDQQQSLAGIIEELQKSLVKTNEEQQPQFLAKIVADKDDFSDGDISEEQDEELDDAQDGDNIREGKKQYLTRRVVDEYDTSDDDDVSELQKTSGLETVVLKGNLSWVGNFINSETFQALFPALHQLKLYQYELRFKSGSIAHNKAAIIGDIIEYILKETWTFVSSIGLNEAKLKAYKDSCNNYIDTHRAALGKRRHPILDAILDIFYKIFYAFGLTNKPYRTTNSLFFVNEACKEIANVVPAEAANIVNLGTPAGYKCASLLSNG
jgi:hypothetical protein